LFALQEKLLNRRHESQKAAAYNLATGEAVATKNKTKNEDYFVSFSFFNLQSNMIKL
jgi:hypothetical protein